ncbi:hypothetical protein HYH03_008187 [Edaphochlamys debaryana]|uniref:PHD-type domain-containing protein n=1 Tax=Edaphochlamys debaryana TaxID=47281 RepID=A0A835Y2W4_9CHLO|nr:hypothetical protein HYH03_008187 [Edaphochlamys debaryana]|eukprot:KAG2493673.1 hypothetical protein HYH03_008187 [Edaphochlamys debaryana]
MCGMSQRTSAPAGPSSEAHLLSRRTGPSGRISPSPPADMDAEDDDDDCAELSEDQEVRVVCNGNFGTFLLPTQTVHCHCARCCSAGPAGPQGVGQAPPITPTEFERHSGLLTAKKWRNSIRLAAGDGTITIGKWLEQHNILPRPKCSGGPLGSPGPGGSNAGVFAPHGLDAGPGYHPGPSSGNDSHHTGGMSGRPGAADPAMAQGLRSTLPPSRYPASEYVTGEEDEDYDGGGGGGHMGGDNGDGEGYDDGDGGDDEDYDGEAGYGEDGHGMHGRMGRRPVQRSARLVGGAVRLERRGPMGGRLQAPGGLGRLAVMRHRAGGSRGSGAPLPRPSGPSGAGSGVRRVSDGRRHGSDSQDEGAGGERKRGGHSSSEGSPPSDDRRDGSGGSGEGDGSGTGDAGDSRRPGPAGNADDHKNDDGRRHGSTKPGQQSHLGREGSGDGNGQDRSARHASAAKRLPQDYMAGSEAGPANKRARTRPGPNAPGTSAGELASISDVAGPQVRGWRYLGAAAGPAAEQVIISVTINGRVYTGLLAPQQVPPPTMGGRAALPVSAAPSVVAPSASAGRKSMGRPHPSFPVGRPSALIGRPGSGPLSPGRQPAEPEVMPEPCPLDDGPLDDGMPADCPRCALCHRCAHPVLALPPPTPKTATAPSAELLALPPPPTAAAADPASVTIKLELSGSMDVDAEARHEAAAAAEAKPEAEAAEALAMSAAREDSGPSAVRLGRVEPAELVGASPPHAPVDMEEEHHEAWQEPTKRDSESGNPKTETAMDATAIVSAASADAAALVPALMVAEAPELAREASRTAREKGSGLGPLVEIKVGAEHGAASSSVLVHSQCALWSPDVFLIGGTMYGVAAVIKRGRARRCTHCGRSGATLTCCSAKCGRAYHLPCAMEAGAVLVAEPYSVACPDHRSINLHTTASGQLPSRANSCRQRPSMSIDGSHSTASASAGCGYAGPREQVQLPACLQNSSGRRFTLQPPVPSSQQQGAQQPAVVSPTAAAAAAGGTPPPPQIESLPARQPSRGGDVAGGLPALMMLRGQPGLGGCGLPQPPASCMPPPRTTSAGANTIPAAPAAEAAPAEPADEAEEPEPCIDTDGHDVAAAEALAPKRLRVDVGGFEGATAKPVGAAAEAAAAAAAASAPVSPTSWPGANAFLFERRAAQAAAVNANIANAATRAANALAALYGTSAATMGLSSGHLETSAASDLTALMSSQAGKRRRDDADGAGEADGAAANDSRLRVLSCSQPAMPSGNASVNVGSNAGNGLHVPAVFMRRYSGGGGSPIDGNDGGDYDQDHDMAMDAAGAGSHAGGGMSHHGHGHHRSVTPDGVHDLLRLGQAARHLGSGSLANEASVGSPFVSPPVRGMPGGGGRPRHHHPHSQAYVDGRSALVGEGSQDGSPHHNGGGFPGLHPAHVLPRAARNIESLLPSRPLLHNPYVPSSGDPSADLALSKIAQNGSREVEAELLGGTTGRAGHSGRCAVCVIQRKGKCGTESAPKKCLRRQLVALQRATGGNPPAITEEMLEEHLQAVGVTVADIDVCVEPTYGEENRAAAVTAAAEQRARERARRETWSLPLGQGSGAAGRRAHQQY